MTFVRKLRTEVSESSARTGDDNPITDMRTTLQKRAVDSDTLRASPLLVLVTPTDSSSARTAHMIAVASALSRPSGMGVT